MESTPIVPHLFLPRTPALLALGRKTIMVAVILVEVWTALLLMALGALLHALVLVLSLTTHTPAGRPPYPAALAAPARCANPCPSSRSDNTGQGTTSDESLSQWVLQHKAGVQ